MTAPPTGLPATAALFYAPDGYEVDREKLMGRNAAGYGFLRAAAAAHRDRPLWACTPSQKFAHHFKSVVAKLEPRAQPSWVPPLDFERMKSIGVLYRPDSVLSQQARLRLRAGIGAWSICGVTHTTCTHTVMDEIASYAMEPVFPWDGLVCTSTFVRATIDEMLSQQEAYHAWRFGHAAPAIRPKLPVIPLGVHTQDHAFEPAQRAAAREALGVGEDTVVCLFVGRLSYAAKAHPMPMYQALETVAARTGKPLMLVECGWHGSDHVRDAFQSAQKLLCPGVTCTTLDGREAHQRTTAWAGADIFVSLSDNIQETFGLTPIEAMAAGLPVLATAWDGYRDTVRHGIDGFLVPTRLPPAIWGHELAARYETEIDSYDLYCGQAALHVAADPKELTDRLADLVDNPALRRTMGAAGRERARSVYEWSTIFARYQEFWAELSAIRNRESANFSPFPFASRHTRPSPFGIFRGYATDPLDGRHLLICGECRVPVATLRGHAMSSFALVLPQLAALEQLARLIEQRAPIRVDDLVKTAGLPTPVTVRSLMWLLKFDYARVAPTVTRGAEPS